MVVWVETGASARGRNLDFVNCFHCKNTLRIDFSMASSLTMETDCITTCTLRIAFGTNVNSHQEHNDIQRTRQIQCNWPQSASSFERLKIAAKGGIVTPFAPEAVQVESQGKQPQICGAVHDCEGLSLSLQWARKSSRQRQVSRECWMSGGPSMRVL